MPPAQIHHGQELDAQFVFDLFLERVHQRIVEHGHLMGGALVNIAGGEDRKLVEELRQFLRRGDRHFQIARGNGLKLSVLGDQRGVVVGHVGREVGNRRGKDRGQRDRALICLRGRGGHAKRDLVLRTGWRGKSCKRQRKRHAAGYLYGHSWSSSVFLDPLAHACGFVPLVGDQSPSARRLAHSIWA